jgi:hypothetical protein
MPAHAPVGLFGETERSGKRARVHRPFSGDSAAAGGARSQQRLRRYLLTANDKGQEPRTMPIPITAALISAITALAVAIASAWWALGKVRRERGFDRRREWYEKTMETISEFYHHVSVYWSNSGPGQRHPAIAEMHNVMMAASLPIIRLTLASRLYASVEAVAALDALHTDTADIMTYLHYLPSEEQGDALKHLRRRILHASDVLTAAYRRELRFEALPPLLCEEGQKELTAWKMRKPNPDYAM